MLLSLYARVMLNRWSTTLRDYIPYMYCSICRLCRWPDFNWQQCLYSKYMKQTSVGSVSLPLYSSLSASSISACVASLHTVHFKFISLFSCILAVFFYFFCMLIVCTLPSRVGKLINFLTIALMVGIINMYEMMLHIPNQISVHNREQWKGWCIIYLHVFYF